MYISRMVSISIYNQPSVISSQHKTAEHDTRFSDTDFSFISTIIY